MDGLEDQNKANLPKISKEWPEKLWSMVEQANQGSNTFASAPMKEIYANPSQCEFDTIYVYGYIGSIESQESLDKDFKEMPHYLSEHEAKSKIRALPSSI